MRRRSATPENTADNGSKCRSVCSASRRAIVVLPQPGGPHRISRAELARRQHAAERALGPQQMLLAQDIAQRLGPQAFGERRRGERGEELGRHGQRNWTVLTMPSRLMVTLETPPVTFFLRSATFFTSWPLTATIMSPGRTKRPA